MFAEWVTHGAEIGITAFVAIAVFLICAGLIAGLVTLFGSVSGGEQHARRDRNEERETRYPYRGR